MKKLLNHSLLMAVLLFLFQMGKGQALLFSAVLVIAFYILRTRDRTVFFFIILLSLSLIPHTRTDYPKVQQARVVSVSASSFIAEGNGCRFIVRYDEPPAPDSEIALSGRFEKNESSAHFFGMDFSDWNERRGIYYAIRPASLTVIKEHHTFRSFLYHRIIRMNDPSLKSLCFKMLLGINDPDEESFFYRCGFSLSGIIMLVREVLGRFCNERKRNRIVFILTCVLFIAYGFPLLLFQSLVSAVLKKMDQRQDVRVGIGMIIVMLVYPESVCSAAFLLPSCFRLCALEKTNRKLKGFYLSCLLQSYLFQGFNPLVSLLFSYLRPLLGAGWFLALGCVVTGRHDPLKLLRMMNESITLLDRFFLPGSIMGLGTLFYLAILISLHSRKHLIHYAVILLFVFQLGGFFHPFGEITFINVGQGDSIFIRMPLSHEGMLIDTGKPGQYRTVTAYLKAKGTWKLDIMAITHGDDDHSGSMDRLNQAYHVRQLIQVHQKKITYGMYDFYDLNEITDEDENRSSLVLYTKINGMRMLFMGDADEVAEKEIAEKYGNLRCDVLKLSHHGSKTGSCDRFLDMVRPGLGIISSGPYRIYHHPSPETIQRLLKRHIPYLDTKKQGDITILMLPHMNLCISAAGSLGIINTQ